MIDEAHELRRQQIRDLEDQILAHTERFTDHVLDHPGEFMLATVLAGTLREQLRLLRRLKRAHLVEVRG